MRDLADRVAYGYARESKGREKGRQGREVRSVREQSDLITRWSAENGLDLRRVYADDVSASDYGRREREDWHQLMDQLANEPVGSAVLVCFHVSRMSRDVVVWGPLLGMCRDRDVLIVVDGRVYDVTDSSDEFTLMILFAVGTKQSRDTSEFILRAANANAQQGRPWGKVHYGYRRLKNQLTGAFEAQVPDHDQAEVVKIIFRLARSGMRPSTIAAKLNADGIPSRLGGGWKASSVRNVLLCKAYIGIRVHEHKGTVTETRAVWDALVTEDDFWAVQRLLAERTPQSPRAPRTVHMLSGLIGCLRCKYRCRNECKDQRRVYGCPQGHYVIGAVEADDYVSEVAVAMLSDPRNWDRLAAADDAAVALASAELDRALAEAKELEAAAAGMSVAVVAAMDQAIQRRIAQARSELSGATLPPILRDVVGPAAESRWDTMALPARREVISAALDIKGVSAGRAKNIPVHRRLVIAPRFA